MQHKPTTPQNEALDAFIGLDLGDRFTAICVLNHHGEVENRFRCHTTRDSFEKHFARRPRARLALEAKKAAAILACLPARHLDNSMYQLTQMKKFYILLCVLFGPYATGIICLANADPARYPSWAWRAVGLYFLGAIVVLVLWGRPRASPESGQPCDPTIAKQRRISRWGIALYLLVLINGIALVARESVPLVLAVPGLAMIVLTIGAYWWIGAKSKVKRGGDGGK